MSSLPINLGQLDPKCVWDLIERLCPPNQPTQGDEARQSVVHVTQAFTSRVSSSSLSSATVTVWSSPSSTFPRPCQPLLFWPESEGKTSKDHHHRRLRCRRLHSLLLCLFFLFPLVFLPVLTCARPASPITVMACTIYLFIRHWSSQGKQAKGPSSRILQASKQEQQNTGSSIHSLTYWLLISLRANYVIPIFRSTFPLRLRLQQIGFDGKERERRRCSHCCCCHRQAMRPQGWALFISPRSMWLINGP